MKTFSLISYLVIALVFFNESLYSQQTTLQVVGRNLVDINGQTTVLRGVNYPILDHGSLDFTVHSDFEAFIDEASLTGANAIRISWYTDGSHWRDNPTYGGTPGTIDGLVANGHLDALIGYCIEKGMTPILDVHNLTCTDDWAAFNANAMAFWQSSPVVDLIQNHQARIIINLANELGKVRWSASPQATALATYTTNYTNAIQTLRGLNINVPIMIDAPDCGQSSTEMLSVAESINDADPRHNTIFSAHAYWGGYASTMQDIQTKLTEAENTNVCFILGEVAMNQDNNTCGDLDLSAIYPIILQEACNRNIGWLAWTYELDCSAARTMTTDGYFANLTTFGNDIVYNVNYGLQSGGNCQAVPVSINKKPLQSISLFPTSDGFLISYGDKLQTIQVFDALGNHANFTSLGNGDYRLLNASACIYIIVINTSEGKASRFKLLRGN